MKRLKLFILVLIIILGLVIHYAKADQNNDVPLIPIKVLFGNPEKISPKISHDGKYIAYIAPVNGVLNLWLKTVGLNDDQPITNDTGRGVTYYFWAFNNRQILYIQDQGGDENWRLYALDIQTKKVNCLTPPDPNIKHPVQARVVGTFYKTPDVIVVGLNKNNPQVHDLYELNTVTGELKLLQKSEVYIAGYVFDNDFKIRGYYQLEPDGGASLFYRKDVNSPYHKVLQRSMEDVMSSNIVGFTPDNKRLYIIDSANRNAAALVEFDPETKTEKVIAGDPQYDVSAVIMHPTQNTLIGVAYQKERVDVQLLNSDYKKDFDILVNPNKGDIAYTSSTLDFNKWLIAYYTDDGPVKYYLYNRQNHKLEFLFDHTTQYQNYKLAKMQPISFKSRDGLTIHGYLTLPINAKLPVPMVLNVHGGPWARDGWGIHPEAQFFANRGYACLQVNYRGSTGYGKEFLNAGNREWGGKMQDDLTDAVYWAIAQGYADPKKIVIYGGSYGGYAALAGVTFTPDLYVAGISLVGPSNLETFLNTIPPYWEVMRKQFDLRVGRIPRYVVNGKAGLPKDPKDYDEADKKEIEFIRSRSPLFFVDRVKVPMLIAQGANDPRVKRAESDQFVEAMKQHGLEVEYVVYPDEGHGFVRPENSIDFYHRVDRFLAKILGGRYEK